MLWKYRVVPALRRSESGVFPICPHVWPYDAIIPFGHLVTGLSTYYIVPFKLIRRLQVTGFLKLSSKFSNIVNFDGTIISSDRSESRHTGRQTVLIATVSTTHVLY